MGYWNGTCMISNLPIKGGEPVVAFVIKYTDKNIEYSGVCYSNCYARSISLPIYAEYNDYGNIENFNENSLAIKHLLHIFNTNDIDELLNSIERDEKNICLTTDQKDYNVGLVMINKLIYDRLISTYGTNSYTPNVEKIINGLKTIRESKRLKLKLEKKDRLLFDLTLLPLRLGLNSDVFEEKDLYSLVTFAMGLSKNHNKKIALELAKGLRERDIINTQISNLRKLWFGPSGKGLQQLSYHSHLILADTIKEHIFNSFDSPEEAYLTILGKRDY